MPQRETETRREDLQSSSRLSDAEEEKLSAEIASCLSAVPTVAEADDALLFWKSRTPYYPTLHRLASRFLAVSATSVPVESMFSTTGLTINSRHNYEPCASQTDLLHINT